MVGSLARSGGRRVRWALWSIVLIPFLCLVAGLAGAIGPAVADCPGPDGDGYSCSDSDDLGGPAFSWVDISQTGTSIPLDDDDYEFPIDLPFAFQFYGQSYTQIAVGANGGVYFEDTDFFNPNTALPTSGAGPGAFIAAYWDDLNPGTGGDVLYEVTGTAPDRAMVVEWKDIPLYSNSEDTLTMEVVLLEGSNNVLVQYLEPTSEGGQYATLGIQKDPAASLQYSYDEAALQPQTSICYTSPGSSDPNCRNYTPEPGSTLLGLAALAALGWLRRVFHDH